MTTHAPQPVMLDSNPHHHVFARRSSVRRGTISSLSKDVRASDFVEIIKQQKAIQQQESLLKRRHSMANMSVKTKSLRSRTVSSTDLNRTFASSQQKQQSTSKQLNATITPTDAFRLASDQQQQPYQHTRKCSACFVPTCKQQEREEQEDSSSNCSVEEVNHISPSTSTSSNEESSPSGSEILEHLQSSIQVFSSHLMNGKSTILYDTKTLQECKALIAKQQFLLSQLEVKVNQREKSNSLSQLYNQWKAPKPKTTQLVIKQTADKNDFDTVFAVSGICTTIEASLIPDKLLYHAKDHAVYQHKYDIQIAFGDRFTKFKLLDASKWQADKDTHICSFQQCKQEFNWLQRKHHCRGCGQIYCGTHSGNRLPLFNSKSKQPIFSRVCDTCFYHVAKDSLSSL